MAGKYWPGSSPDGCRKRWVPRLCTFISFVGLVVKPAPYPLARTPRYPDKEDVAAASSRTRVCTHVWRRQQRLELKPAVTVLFFLSRRKGEKGVASVFFNSSGASLSMDRCWVEGVNHRSRRWDQRRTLSTALVGSPLDNDLRWLFHWSVPNSAPRFSSWC